MSSKYRNYISQLPIHTKEYVKELYTKGIRIRDGRLVTADNHNYILSRKMSPDQKNTVIKAFKFMSFVEEFGEKDIDFFKAEAITPKSVSKAKSYKAPKRFKSKNKYKAKKYKKKLKDIAESREVRGANLIKETFISKYDVIVKSNSLYVYDKHYGYYGLIDTSQFTSMCTKMLDSETNRLTIKSSEYDEAYKLILSDGRLLTEEPFYENGALVNCENGVYDAENKVLLPHSPKYFFNYCIRASYSESAECKCFRSFLNTITNNHDSLKRLFLCTLAYLLSSFKNAKKAVAVLGDTDTGKSTLFKFFAMFFDEGLVSYNDFSNIGKPSYVVKMARAILNISFDVSDKTLSDTGFFKQLTSDTDTIVVSSKYGEPHKVSGGIKMVFITNHNLNFPPSLSVEDINAIFSRLIFLPFQNKTVAERDKDSSLFDNLASEKDGVFSLLMESLSDFVQSGNVFPECEISERAKELAKAKYCPEAVFFSQCLKKGDSYCVSTKDLRTAFMTFCSLRGIENKKKGDITKYMTEKGYSVSRIRVDADGNKVSHGNPQEAYVGFKVSNKFKSELLDF